MPPPSLRLPPLGRLAAPWPLFLCALALPRAAAAEGEIAVARAELAALLGRLDAAVHEGAAPGSAATPAAVWLRGEAGPLDLELARGLCRPRYAALASAGAAMDRCLATADAAGAEAIYQERILPVCLELSICLRAADAALAAAAPAAKDDR